MSETQSNKQAEALMKALDAAGCEEFKVVGCKGADGTVNAGEASVRVSDLDEKSNTPRNLELPVAAVDALLKEKILFVATKRKTALRAFMERCGGLKGAVYL